MKVTAPTIAIVDDNQRMRDALSMLIEATGDYHSIQATNGAEGLDLITSMKPNLAILDINMPVMNGIELLAKLKEDPNTSSIPVIMLSASDDVRVGKDETLKSADMYLCKPCSREMLTSAIRVCLLENTASGAAAAG